MEERLRFDNLALFANGYSVMRCSLFATDRLVGYLKNWRANYDRPTCSSPTLRHLQRHPPVSKASQGAVERVLRLADGKRVRLARPAAFRRSSLLAHGRGDQPKAACQCYGGDASKWDVREHNLDYLRRGKEAAEWCCELLEWVPVECVIGRDLRERGDVYAKTIRLFGV